MRTFFLSAFVILFICGCSAPHEEQRIADYRALGELRVATRLDAVSYRIDDAGQVSGFEHDLLLRLGEELGVPVRFLVYADTLRALDAVIGGEAHIAAAGLNPNQRLPLQWSSALREVDYVLAAHAGSPDITREADLAGRTISARRGTLPAEAVEQIRQRVPSLNIRLRARADDQSLLDLLVTDHADLVATDRIHYALAAQTDPELVIAYDLSLKTQIAWAIPPQTAQGSPNPLLEQIDRFLADARESKLLTRIGDRYFGYTRRLDDADILTLFSHVRSRLPGLRRHFYDAQMQTGIDWRYLAALAYQESQWDAAAVSRTGVRGLMMLTAETADRLNVNDRFDARQSILGGARYFAQLKDQLPDEVADPDRNWIATAAYNLGMGHMNGARAIARGMGRDSASWWDMKAVLPLLSRPEYAARLKSGAARGGEAVIMTENIRNYYDILTRIEPPYDSAAPPHYMLSLQE